MRRSARRSPATLCTPNPGALSAYVIEEDGGLTLSAAVAISGAAYSTDEAVGGADPWLCAREPVGHRIIAAAIGEHGSPGISPSTTPSLAAITLRR